MKQEEYFGFGSINNLFRIIEKIKASRILLVTGKNSFIESGAANAVEPLLKKYDVRLFQEFSPNPTKEQIEFGNEIANKYNPDVIVAIGGGSAIDVAKGIKASRKEVPLVAIPTTGGTGSEATHFFVYYDGFAKKSEELAEKSLPEYVICDPGLIMSLPKNVAAATGIDALGQAIESYWSIYATEESQALAKKAIILLQRYLKESVLLNTKKAKEMVMRAANFSGKAINITKTTACHALSYPLTSHFNIPHGHAVGLTLGVMFIFNTTGKNPCAHPKGEDHVKKTMEELMHILQVDNEKKAKEKIEKLMEEIGLSTKLSQLGLRKKDLKIIIENGFYKGRIENNPRKLDAEVIKNMLEHIYQ